MTKKMIIQADPVSAVASAAETGLKIPTGIVKARADVTIAKLELAGKALETVSSGLQFLRDREKYAADVEKARLALHRAQLEHQATLGDQANRSKELDYLQEVNTIVIRLVDQIIEEVRKPGLSTSERLEWIKNAVEAVGKLK